MNTTAITSIKKVIFHKNGVWVIIGIFFSVITGNAIADAKWIYLAALLAPFLIYISIKNPFIFPFGLYVFLLPFDDVIILTEGSKGPTLTKFLAILTIRTEERRAGKECRSRWSSEH